LDKAEFTAFVKDVFKKDFGYQFLITYVDHKRELVEIRRIGVARHRRHNDPIFCYASSLACRCHWSEVAAWCNGYKHGYSQQSSDIQPYADANVNIIKKLENRNMYLHFDRESGEPAKFHIISNDIFGPRAEDGVLFNESRTEDLPTYRTLSEVERWFEGWLYGTEDHAKDEQARKAAEKGG